MTLQNKMIRPLPAYLPPSAAMAAGAGLPGQLHTAGGMEQDHGSIKERMQCFRKTTEQNPETKTAEPTVALLE